jgi:hypothetical protein
MRLELVDVAGGWEQAVFGPPDQVDWRLVVDGEVRLASYDSVHTFLQLYDCVSRERTTHPSFFGVQLDERGDGLRVGLHGAVVETSYAELAGALESFLGALFRELDAETHGDVGEYVARLDRDGPVVADVAGLRERLLAE